MFARLPLAPGWPCKLGCVDNLSLGQESLRRHLDILKRRKWTLALTCAICLGITTYFTYRQTPLYTSEAHVLVLPLPGLALGQATQPVNLATELQVASSVPVAARVVKNLDLTTDPLALLGGLSVTPDATSGGLSEVMTLSYTSPSPATAQEVADQFAHDYISYRRHQSRHALSAIQKTLEKRFADLQQQLDEVTRQENAAVDEEKEILSATLDARRNTLLARLGVLEQRLQDVQPDKTASLGGGDIIRPASIPVSPSSPNVRQNVSLGLLVGLALGIGLVLLRDRLDDRFKGRTDVISTLHVPVLATVPRYRLPAPAGGSSQPQSLQSIVVIDPLGAASEAYRALRTGLLYSSTQMGRNSFLITSAHPSEGKTTTIVNLSIALAQAGTSTVLVSADLRKPTLESLLEIDAQEGPGLSEWLKQPDLALDAIVRRVIPNLHLVSSGTIPQNPSELLNSRRLPAFIEELEKRFDIVLVDSPPVLAVTDAQILGPKLGGTVMVINASHTRRSAAAHAKDEMERMGASLVGAVLNAFDKSSPYYSEYKADYYSNYSDLPASNEGNGSYELPLRKG